MKKFLINIISYFIIAGVLFLSVPIIGSYFVQSKPFNNGNNESNLLSLGVEREYDILFLGNSHARNFSRYNQHDKLEKHFDKKVLNMGQGSGLCGINDQKFYLKYLLNNGYEFKNLIYTVSPQIMYGSHLDSVTITFFNEPFDLNFAYQYLSHPAPNKFYRIFHYIKTKWKPSWLTKTPSGVQEKNEKLEVIDKNIVSKGMNLAYPNGINEKEFLQSAKQLEELINMASKHNIKVFFIETPILFEEWPGQKRFSEYCRNLEKNGFVKYLDFKNVFTEPKYFYDHHHLNTEGMEKFRSILKKKMMTSQN